MLCGANNGNQSSATMYEDAVRWTNRNMTSTHAAAPRPAAARSRAEEPSYLFQKLPTPNAAPPPHTSDFLSRPRVAYLYLLIGVILCSQLVISVRGSDMESIGGRGHYTPTWAVHIPEGDVVAQNVANEHGMVIVGKVSDFPDLYSSSKIFRQKSIRQFAYFYFIIIDNANKFIAMSKKILILTHRIC